MSANLSKPCPQCGKIMAYTSETLELQCPCGQRFWVVEFVSEWLKMEKAQKALASAEAEKAALQNTLAALDGIFGSQRGAEPEVILESLKVDRQTYNAMAALLHAVRADQQSGPDALSRLLDEGMKRQSGAAEKLTAVREFAAFILTAQQSGAEAVEQMQKKVVDLIKSLSLNLGERLALSKDFYAWSGSMQPADVQRLRDLQSSSVALLQRKKDMTDKLNRLSQSIGHNADFDRPRKRHLDKLIALYRQATGLQLNREFEQAENTYRRLLAEGGPDAQDAEIYWRVLLCHYGVEFQEKNGECIPIILRPNLTEPDKAQARTDLLNHIQTDEQRAYYTEQLRKIDFYRERSRIDQTRFQSGPTETPAQIAENMETWLKLRNYEQVIANYESIKKTRPGILKAEPLLCLYTLCAQNQVRTLEELAAKGPRLLSDRLYELAYEYANPALRARLDALWKTEEPNHGGKKYILAAICLALCVCLAAFVLPRLRKEAPADTFSHTEAIEAAKSTSTPTIAPASTPTSTEAPKETSVSGKVYSNGTYTGQLVNGKRHGNGVMEYTNGDKYDGEWKDDLRSGKGVYSYANGDRYDGEWKDGSYNGKGIYSYANGDRYDGEWKDSLPHGKGVYYYANGDRYDGEWKDNLRHGKGVYYYANGAKYESEWKDDTDLFAHPEAAEADESTSTPTIAATSTPAPTEAPKETYVSGKSYSNGLYTGQLVNGKRHGNGVMEYPNGNKYEGEWKDDKQNGKGVYSNANGGKYDGEWKDGSYNGKGIYSYANGDKYDGEWEAGKCSGTGIMYYANGDKYEGEWKNYSRHGIGVYYYANGDRYEGEWKNGRKNGKGILYYANGDKYESEWKDDTDLFAHPEAPHGGD